MGGAVVIGAQWGDEGKGKIVDLLAERFEIVARYQGGNNAGHTVVHGDETFKFHLLPSGILEPDKICILGNGVVIDPEVLVGELDGLEARRAQAERVHDDLALEVEAKRSPVRIIPEALRLGLVHATGARPLVADLGSGGAEATTNEVTGDGNATP